MTTLLLDTFARFIAVALKSGRAAIAIITASHRDGLASRLKAQGIDVDDATQQGTYIQLDVNKTFSLFMVNDVPDSTRFFPVVAWTHSGSSQNGDTKASWRCCVWRRYICLVG